MTHHVLPCVGWPVCHNFIMGREVTLHDPTRALVLKGFATFWEFSFYGQKKVADNEYHSLFAEKIHFNT